MWFIFHKIRRLSGRPGTAMLMLYSLNSAQWQSNGNKFKNPYWARALDQPWVIHTFTIPHYPVYSAIHCCVAVVILSQNEKVFHSTRPSVVSRLTRSAWGWFIKHIIDVVVPCLPKSPLPFGKKDHIRTRSILALGNSPWAQLILKVLVEFWAKHCICLQLGVNHRYPRMWGWGVVGVVVNSESTHWWPFYTILLL